MNIELKAMLSLACAMTNTLPLLQSIHPNRNSADWLHTALLLQTSIMLCFPFKCTVQQQALLEQCCIACCAVVAYVISACSFKRSSVNASIAQCSNRICLANMSVNDASQHFSEFIFAAKSAVVLLIDYKLYVMYKNYRCILSDVRTLVSAHSYNLRHPACTKCMSS